MPVNTEVAERFALVLAGSLIFHFAVIFGLQIRIQPPQPVSRPALQVRLEPVVLEPPAEALTLTPSKDVPPPVEPKTLETPPPEQAAQEPGEPAPQEIPLASALPLEQTPGLPAINLPLVEDPTYYPALEVDVHPVAQQDIIPLYPERAADDKITGSVILLLNLDESGLVQEISVEASDPPGHFDQAALDAFRHARFSPAQRQGRIVKSRMRIKVSFDLIEKPPAASTSVVDKREQK